VEFAAAAFFLILTSCQSPPEDLADCAVLSSPTAREECRYEMVAPLADDPRVFEAALEQIEAPYSRDLIRYRLAFQDPQKYSRLCKDVEEPSLHEKCRQIIGRPHLSSTRKKP